MEWLRLDVVGAGLNDEVLALTYNEGILYAAGKFSQAGSVASSGAAYWNGVVLESIALWDPKLSELISTLSTLP